MQKKDDDSKVLVIHEKEKKKRKISNSSKWQECVDDIDMDNQQLYMTTNTFIQSHIKEKIRGYKSQDLKKKRYDVEKFIDYEFVINRLLSCDLTCFYCQKKIQIIYENSREMQQWTIERIDNEYGHNKDNIEIACLQCNLSRYRVSANNFMKTKRLQIKIIRT
jgi:hypothetical protein